MRRQQSEPPHIEGYDFVRFLKGGGFADVFIYSKHQRNVAVKVLLRDVGGKQATFEAEAQAMARLSNHSSIVTIYDAGVAAGGAPYLIMEYCNRGDVSLDLVARPYALDRALEIAIAVAGAVETAHRMGILHRDIKPANILFTQGGKPALTDFGISGSLTGQSEGPDAFSTQWAPPEQISGGAMTRAGDVYSLAATLWTMVVGRSPFILADGPNDNLALVRRVMTAPVPPTRVVGVPESLERVLAIAMAKDPDQRYQSAAEFAFALNAVQNEMHIRPTPLEVLSDDEEIEADSGERSGTVVSGYTPVDPSGTSQPVETNRHTSPGATPTSQPVASTLDRGAPHAVTESSTHVGGDRRLQPGVIDAFGSGSPTRVTQLPALPVPGLIEGDTQRADRTGDARVARPPDPPVEPPPAGGSRVGVIAAAVAALFAVGGVSAYLILSQGDSGTTAGQTTNTTAAPVDPIGDVVPPLVGLTLAKSGSKVTAKWSNPAPLPGDVYLYGVLDPSTELTLVQTSETRVTVPAVKGRTCVSVQLVRQTGSKSDPIKECV